MGKDDETNPSKSPTLDRALMEALESVEKYARPKQTRTDPDDPNAEETVIEVQIEARPDGSDPDPAPAPATGTPADSVEFEQLKVELEKARQEAQETHERMLRVAADADNIRKRALKERQDAIKYGLEGVLRDLLPVIDNLERTLAHVPAEGQDPGYGALREGVEMVLKQFLNILDSHNVKPFESVGLGFDPTRHEALSRQETSEVEPGVILSEMHRGYQLHDRLLRPALVAVACAPADQAAGPDSSCPAPDAPADPQADTAPSDGGDDSQQTPGEES